MESQQRVPIRNSESACTERRHSNSKQHRCENAHCRTSKFTVRDNSGNGMVKTAGGRTHCSTGRSRRNDCQKKKEDEIKKWQEEESHHPKGQIGVSKAAQCENNANPNERYRDRNQRRIVLRLLG